VFHAGGAVVKYAMQNIWKSKRNEPTPGPRALCPISAYGAIESKRPLSTKFQSAMGPIYSQLGLSFAGHVPRPLTAQV
jgi:hypothetical protein